VAASVHSAPGNVTDALVVADEPLISGNDGEERVEERVITGGNAPSSSFLMQL
jgi:hypothetical protein